MPARCHIVLRCEQPSSGRTEAHDLEEVAAHKTTPRALGGVVNGDAVGLVVLRHDVDERGAIAEVLVVRIRPRSALAFAVLHRGDPDTAWVNSHRNGPKKDRLYPGENCRVGANAEA